MNIEKLLEKYEIASKTLLELATLTETQEEDEKALACRRFVAGFISDIRDLQESISKQIPESLIDKYIDRIKVDYPEDDKLMIDLKQFANELLLNYTPNQMHQEPVGYLFNGRFYKSMVDLRGKTMSDDNQPQPLFTNQKHG